MRWRVVAIGSRMPAWVEQACAEYGKRMPPEMRLQWLELPLGQRGKNAPPARAIASESEAMLARIDDRQHVIALDQGGQAWSTERLAEKMHGWQVAARDVSLLIGGPDGLGEACKQRADESWSLSPLTLPHPLVRVVLIEQLYRAWTINQGHPYHK